ncbi:FecR family protein [Pedobacter metabolipauper]|nr:FecR family protein [Pedobacter metabolipauper]
MEKEEFISVSAHVADGSATESDLIIYNTYYDHFQTDHPEWNTVSDRDKEEIKNTLYQKIDTGIHPARKSTGIIKLWPQITAAAVLLLTVGIAVLFYFKHQPSSQMQLVNDVAPGKNTAILTLANGKKIDLGGTRAGKVVAYGNVTVTRTKNGQLLYAFNNNPKTNTGDQQVAYNTISTPRGGQIQINLPDGTRVWLNADSRLIIPSTFNLQPNRQVKMEGEGYFEVAHNPNKPFQVTTNDQVVEVLGTHFNINSYADEPETKTTLLAGSVKVNQQILKPGQQSVISGNEIKVLTVDPETETGWKDGVFIFDGQDFKSLMRTISRWYDVEVVYEYVPENLHIVARVSRYRNISEVLRRLEQTEDVNFKIEGRRIRVIK